MLCSCAPNTTLSVPHIRALNWKKIFNLLFISRAESLRHHKFWWVSTAKWLLSAPTLPNIFHIIIKIFIYVLEVLFFTLSSWFLCIFHVILKDSIISKYVCQWIIRYITTFLTLFRHRYAIIALSFITYKYFSINYSTIGRPNTNNI